MSDSDDPTPGSSGISTPPKKKGKIWYQQSFNQEWLKDSQFKDWLKPDVNDKYAASCSVCDTKLKNCNKSTLMLHKASAKHMKNFNAKKSFVNIETYFKKTQESDSENEVAKAELLLTGYIAEHSVPFRQADHLVEVIKNMFPKYEPPQNLKLKRTKASYLLQDGIACEEKMLVAKICRNTFFSVIIDECTDVSISQVLAVMVRYFDEDKRKVTDSLCMIEVENATAEGLYKCVKDLFHENDIPISNIIGFASDNCSTMLGTNKEVQALLKKDVPSVFVMGCVCHSLALCCSEACKHLPSWAESFIKDVCCYFARSSKRQHDFQMIQDVVHVPKHRILKLSQTRWLSRGAVIARILEQWDALLLFFESESKTDKIDGTPNIYKTIVTSGTKHMLQFLNYIIPNRQNESCISIRIF